VEVLGKSRKVQVQKTEMLAVVKAAVAVVKVAGEWAG
jgi:hypothetical protein